LRGDGGQAGGEIWVYIEFIVARLPTLQIWGEKKSSRPLTDTPQFLPANWKAPTHQSAHSDDPLYLRVVV
jgi:hypothetical protein